MTIHKVWEILEACIIKLVLRGIKRNWYRPGFEIRYSKGCVGSSPASSAIFQQEHNMHKNTLELIERYAADPALQHTLAKKSMRELDALYKKISLASAEVHKAMDVVREAKHLRQMASAYKPYTAYKNGKVLTKETNYSLTWVKIFFDFFRPKKIHGSYSGFSPGGSIDLDNKRYEFSLHTDSLETEVAELFSLSLIEIKQKIKENKFEKNTDHKKLYKARLTSGLDPINYKVVIKGQLS